MLTPEISLIPQDGGSFTLMAVTLCPNSCYRSAGAFADPPPGVVLIPEALGVTLAIKLEGQVCLQVITPVRHRLPSLNLGPQHGRTSVVAFVTVNGVVSGQASIPVPPLRAQPAITAGSEVDPLLGTRDWYAWINLMPGAPSRLYVTGTVITRTPVASVELVPAVPQGINPAQLILDLRLGANSPLQVVTETPVRYEQAAQQGQYTTVAIRYRNAVEAVVSVDEVQ